MKEKMINYFRRILYFIYYLKMLDRLRLSKFMAYVKDKNNWSFSYQWLCVFRDSILYNVSILEYYQFRFYEISDFEKHAWAGTGTMYEFQRWANPLKNRFVLEDKRQFYNKYRKYFRHEVYTLLELKTDYELRNHILSKYKNLVFKPASGNCGVGIVFMESNSLNQDDIVPWMIKNNFDLVESRVTQHPTLQELSPSGVNTVRIFTCLDAENRCRILGCRLRISVNSPVDNMAAGNLAAPIDEDSGKVCGLGVYSDITAMPVAFHPVTGVEIQGFTIPFWNETLAMIHEVSELYIENRSVGWDIVITPDGPGLIEGNHDWCKLVWQLPVNQGLKYLLEECVNG